MGKPKDSEKHLSESDPVHYKPNIGWSGIEPGPAQWQAGD
jgi:hypothetical protein